jgi:hypothetical protein
MKSEQLPATPNWWWTLSGRVSSCKRCSGRIPEGARIAYDSHARRVLCRHCAVDTGIDRECQASKRFRDWVSS